MRPKKPVCKYCSVSISLFQSNHKIGCNLEGIADILRFRGFLKEAEELDKIGASLK